MERLQKAIGGEPVSKANLDLYYWLAAAHEKDNPLEAIALYRRIQAESARGWPFLGAFPVHVVFLWKTCLYHLSPPTELFFVERRLLSAGVHR